MNTNTFDSARAAVSVALSMIALALACSSSSEDGSDINAAGAGAATGSGAQSAGGLGLVGGSVGAGGTSSGGSTTQFDACTGVSHELEEIGGPLDIYLVFDRTASMGEDCAFMSTMTPPVSSKACFATYALPDYLMNVDPAADTRLAFQFMSLADDDCDGVPYATPLVDLTPLPVDANHAIVQAISDETFEGGVGTHIEGALRGIADYTMSHQTAGRQMIGVLMTDGEPNGCEEDVQALSDIIADHYADTGIKTFVIGMEGAMNDSLEAYASVGGAEPHDDFCAGGPTPCHYWNVGDGSGDAIADALQAIVMQVMPLPCQFEVATLEPQAGEMVDFSKVNVVWTDQAGAESTFPAVPDAASCPTDQPAWYYDNPTTPSNIMLCPAACTLVSGSAAGIRVDLGCIDTVTVQ